MRVFLVDSQPIFRERLKGIMGMERDLIVVGEAATCRDMLRPVDADLLILDDEELDSLALLRSFQKTRPEGQRPLVLVFTKHIDEAHAAEILKAGADGCLCKSDAPATVLNVILNLARQCKRIPNDLAETTLAGNEGSVHSRLSLREYQVLCLLASGMSVTEIVGYLALSVRTVSACQSSLLQKLNLRSNAQMMRYAFKTGMVAWAAG